MEWLMLTCTVIRYFFFEGVTCILISLATILNDEKVWSSWLFFSHKSFHYGSKTKKCELCTSFFNTAPFFSEQKKVKLHVDHHQSHQLGWPIRGLEGLANLIEMMSELLGGLKTVEAERSKLGAVYLKNRVRPSHPSWIFAKKAHKLLACLSTNLWAHFGFQKTIFFCQKMLTF